MINIQTAALVGQIVFSTASLLSGETHVKGALLMAAFWCAGVNLGSWACKRRERA